MLKNIQLTNVPYKSDTPTMQQIIAFVVSNSPFVPERLQSHLQAKLASELLQRAAQKVPGKNIFYIQLDGSEIVQTYAELLEQAGVPKCIRLTHRNILSRARGTNELCQHSKDDIILNWLPFDHIGSLSDWH
jgi:non-ribosomal peptide synthetase component E (peptide arylation enzyme)